MAISHSQFRAKSMSVVSLLSDFGLKDHYLAEMKAVILSIAPNTRIVDVTHEITKNITSAWAHTS